MISRQSPAATRILPAIAALALFVMATSVGGCAGRTAETAIAAVEDTVRIQVGEQVSVQGGALEIGFEAVTSDSRCPKGETCVWEGDAIVALIVRSGDRPASRLELHTSAKGPHAAAYLEWSIRLAALEPYPVTSHTIGSADYVAVLVVDRGQPEDFPTQ